MPGNSARRGAIRKGASKKGPQAGSGGQKARSLRGKGPTPKATDRTAHKAGKRAGSGERSGGERSGGQRADSQQRAGGQRAGSQRAGSQHRGGGSRATKGTSEWVAGRNAVVEALRAEVPVTALYVAARIDTDDRVKEALKSASARMLPMLEASRADLDRLTGGAVHQGLALQVPPYAYSEVEELLQAADRGQASPLLVALDGVTDPRNLGAVVRSVAAFGGHGVIVPERRAAGMTASAWKTSAGAAARVPVARATNLRRALEDLKEAGVFVVGLDMDGDVAPRNLQVAADPVCLVVGAEGKGLSRLVRETCDLVVSIPMAADNESLNAGVAAGVVLYEIAQHRG